MMPRLRSLFPDGLAGRFALLLVAALVSANLVALVVLTIEQRSFDRRAVEQREIERIVGLVSALEAVNPSVRRVIARDASTRFARVRIGDRPLVETASTDARSRDLAERLGAALTTRPIHVAILNRPDARDNHDRGRQREVIAFSIALGDGIGPESWLNVVTSGNPSGGRGIPEQVFLIILGLSLAAVLTVGLFFVRRLTRPLTQLAEAAQAAGRGDRTARVPEKGAREMREAAAAFNTMQAQIARFDAERMRTLAAVGHDLRTPITSLRIRTELLDDEEVKEPMIRTLDAMAVMADGLVTFAREGLEAEDAARIALAPYLKELCEDRGAVFVPGKPATVLARPVAFGRAIGNLIDNALRYGKSARVTLDVKDQMAVIAVEDAGPGIRDERLDAMFEPFIRGDDSRSAETGGAGLGLSIARSIVLAHGGRIGLENLPSEGLRATVKLPLEGQS